MNANIAIPHSNGAVFQHFGKASQFKVYTIVEDRVSSAEVFDAEGVGHDDLALLLVQHGVNAVICDSIGPGAQGALRAAGIVVLAGVSGAADKAVEDLLAGTLVAAQVATCGCHHGSCGAHSCGHGGSCGGCCH